MPRVDSRLDKKLVDTVCACLRKGHSRNVAAAEVGMTIDDFDTWIQRGRANTRGKYREFYNAVNEAEMEGLAKLERDIIENAGRNAANAIRYIKERYKIWQEEERDDDRVTTIIIKPTVIKK